MGYPDIEGVAYEHDECHWQQDSYGSTHGGETHTLAAYAQLAQQAA